MISADFYSTTYNLINPIRQLTDNIEYNPDGTATDIELSDAYWLGWMKWETFPDCWKFSDYVQTSETLTFTNKTQAQNVNVGYVARRYTSAQTGIRFSNIYAKTDSVTMLSMGYPNQYLNKYDIMGCAPATQYRMFYYCNVWYGTTIDYNIVRNAGAQIFHTSSDLLNFLNGVTPLTETTSNIEGLGQLQLTIDVNDVQENGTWIFEGSQNGYFYRATLYFYSMSVYVASDYMSTGAPAGYATEITPMFGIITDNGRHLLCGDTSNFFTVTGQLYLSILANWVIGTNLTIDNGISGGFECQLSKSEISSLPVYGTLFNGNSAFYKTSNGNAGQLLRVLSIAEMKTIIGIMPRVGTVTGSQQSNYGYTENVIWATYVTDENEFTATLITGDLSDDEFKAKLRPWQYDVDEWAENDYTEEDLPPYEPEGDDNPTTSGGDDHLPRRGFSIGGTGGFVTQYALSYSQLHEFANMLWAQFGDADFISNIGTTFLNDYSIKPSDILNYIVSMRVYPFNLADSVSYTDTQSNNIFIGRGVFPYILTTGNTHVIADTCETFDGGYCDVPNYYNDFRDYEPASSIEVYVPYCGSVSIAPSEVVGKRLRLTYGVDYSTGALSATLWVISDTNYTLAVLSGQVAATIQMSASNEMDGILRLTSIATTIGKAMLAEDKIDASKMSDTAKNAAKASNAIGMTSDLVNSVGSGLPVHSIGNTNGFSNFATPPRACITISYHKYKNPQNFAHVYGYKCNRRENLGSLNGYTKCKNVDVSGFTCHEDERSEIKALLESGVYL